MDQDTFADLSANVARLSAELEATRAELTASRQDLAELAAIVSGLCRNLTGRPQADELHDWADIANAIQYGITGRAEATDSISAPSGLPVFLWTRWNFNQEPIVAPNRDGFACYSAWLNWDETAMPVMLFADGETYVTDREAARRDPDDYDGTTFWTGVPGHRRDLHLEYAAGVAGWTRRANEGETDETY